MVYRNLPPLNALRMFEAVARHQSFTRAADELCVTHGAVSRQVAKLEDHVGGRLLVRKGQRVTLTKRGQEYSVVLEKIFNSLANATNESFGIGAGESLNIDLPTTFATRWAIPRLAQFRHEHPQVRLRITTSHNWSELHRNDVDIAVRCGFGGWRQLQEHRLLEETLMPVCSPKLLSGPGPLSIDEMLGFTLLSALTRPDDWSMWLTAAGAKATDYRTGVTFEYSAQAYDAALNGMGVALAQPAFVQEELVSGNLVPISDVVLQSGRAYFIVIPAMNGTNPLIEAFADWLLRSHGDPSRSSGPPPAS